MKSTFAIGTLSLVVVATFPGVHGLTLNRLARKNHIKCLKTGEPATARWTQHDGLICEFTDLVGINYKNPPQVQKDRPKDDHNCMGMCGEGCDGIRIGGPYTQDCFNHDMCTYFNDVDHNKKSGESSPHCGDEYKSAKADYAWGTFHCGHHNGKNELHHSEDIIPDGIPLCRHPGDPDGAWFEKDFSQADEE